MKIFILFIIISVFTSCQDINKDVNDDNKSRPVKGLDMSPAEIILILDSLEDK